MFFILGAIVTLITVGYFGVEGGLILLGGLIVGLYAKSWTMQRDLRQIKTKLGLNESMVQPVPNEEIERELERMQQEQQEPQGQQPPNS